VLILAAVAAVVIVAVVAVTSLGSSSGKGQSSSTTTASHSGHSGGHSHPGASGNGQASEPQTPSVSPAETQVAVLNGTNTTGLAHRLSANLQQSGYSQATPLDGTPPGTRQTTVVQYASGHRAEAEQVAQALDVSTVQPMESAVTPLVGSSTVVVIAGMDKASLVGEASSASSSEAAG
jgi:hypothetical protein